ncbi:uncharacterized protein LOC107808218 isoform X2 [Nicotiana tabacum]|uniref:E2F-associated phosphoprotein-like isoform X2 n=1 Tax=Nicotiana tabacum TaxID=4097 RepID=A0A1S4BH80_TOBAC|nr:PREDICTED: E2F-associated phosphoprotein-like isoform X2 [Nicotiana tabacum]
MNNKDEQHREEREESPSHSQQTVSDDDEIDYSVKPEFYDSELDDKDELWVQKKRGGRTSDAILNCPACFTTLCLDCQRHEKNVTQYRAMFVVNCKIKSEQVAQLGNKRKRGKKGRGSGAAEADSDMGETYKHKTMTEGKDYCERKINLLKSNYEQLLDVATKKKSIADETGVILQAKLRQLAPPAQ